jgi:DNA-binding SARP family transcriptional activator
MSTLRLSLFSTLRITFDGRPCEVPMGHTVQALLGYLLLQRHRSHPREILADLFWGDHDKAQARSCLSTALWRLRAALEPSGISKGTYLVTSPRDEIGFNQDSDYWLDVALFEEQLGRIRTKAVNRMQPTDILQLEHAMQLYTGELLEGFYDDWALRDRERLRSMHLDSLQCLMRYYKDHDRYEDSLTCGQKILGCDPLREDVHREMMRLYLKSGQRGQAIRQYKVLRETLATELGISPMEETYDLYAHIAPLVGQRRLQAVGGAEPTSTQQAVRQLRAVAESLEQVREQLLRGIRLIESGTEHKSGAGTNAE